MSLWTDLSMSERQLFHDDLLASGHQVVSAMFGPISFMPGAPEPVYLWDGEQYTFSAAVSGGEAIVYAPDRVSRGNGFMVAGGVLAASLLILMVAGKG